MKTGDWILRRTDFSYAAMECFVISFNDSWNQALLAIPSHICYGVRFSWDHYKHGRFSKYMWYPINSTVLQQFKPYLADEDCFPYEVISTQFQL